MEKIEVGDQIPLFKVKDHKGYQVTDKDLLGTLTVLYFYPKDDTPGCTKQACDIQAKLNELSSHGIYVIGISPSSIEKHKQFIKNHNLHFTLLSDPHLEMCHSFGIIQEGKFIRSTFGVNEVGKIIWIERHVKVEGHVERILEGMKHR